MDGSSFQQTPFYRYKLLLDFILQEEEMSSEEKNKRTQQPDKDCLYPFFFCGIVFWCHIGSLLKLRLGLAAVRSSAVLMTGDSFLAVL